MSGKWVKFTDKDLQDMESINNAKISEGQDQPLVECHVPNDDALANNKVFGHVSQYYKEGDVLYCDVEIANGKEKDVLNGSKRMVSPAIFSNTKEIYHIAYTGRQAIPIANSKFASFEQFSAGFKDEIEAVGIENESLDNFKEEENMGELENKLDKILETFSSKNIKQEDLAKAKEEIEKQMLEAFSAKLDEVKASYDKDIQGLKDALDEEKKKAAKAEEEKVNTENKTLLEKFSNEGNVLPSQVEICEKIFNCKDIKEIPQLFSDFLKNNKVVDFDVSVNVEGFKSIEDKEDLISEEEKAVIHSEMTRIRG
ncbi:MAG: hypothetical protein WC346_08360 [Methanogenium sp.]|jgi:hypothetical protein